MISRKSLDAKQYLWAVVLPGSVAVGLLVVFLSPVMLILIFIAVVVAGILVTWPRIALYAILALSPYYFIFHTLLTSGRLGGLVTRFSPVDLLTALAMAGVFLKVLTPTSSTQPQAVQERRILAIDLLCLSWVLISLLGMVRGVALGYEAALRASRGPLLFVLYFVAAKEINSTARMRELWSLLLFNSLAIGLVGIAGAAGFLTPWFPNLAVDRVGTLFTRPNFFVDALLTIPNLILLPLMIRFAPPRIPSSTVLAWIAAVLNVSVLMISVTRGFWLGMFAGFLTMLFLLIRLRHVRINYAFHLFAGAIALIIGVEVFINVIGGSSILGSMWDRVSTASAGMDERGLIYRLNEFRVYADSFLESPVLGQGFGAPVAVFDISQNPTAAHNEYIWILQTSGLIGFLVLFLFIYIGVRKSFRYLASSSRMSLEDCFCVLLISVVFGFMVTSVTSGALIASAPLLATLLAVARNASLRSGHAT